MKSPALEQRIRNDRHTPPRSQERCRWCDDSGYVVVQTRTDTWLLPTVAAGRS